MARDFQKEYMENAMNTDVFTLRSHDTGQTRRFKELRDWTSEREYWLDLGRLRRRGKSWASEDSESHKEETNG